MKRILVLSPHPDDEAIGCGGTIRKHVLDGDAVHIVFLTSGERGGHGRTPAITARIREREATDAAAILGVAGVEFWRLPDGAMRADGAASDRLRAKLKQWRPAIIYVPHDREMHPDHRATARLVRRALANGCAPRPKPAVLMFEVWTPLQEFDEVVDVSRYVRSKLAAIRAYKSQCAVMRFDEASLALCRYRGEMHSWPGGRYAEIFSMLDAGGTTA